MFVLYLHYNSIFPAFFFLLSSFFFLLSLLLTKELKEFCVGELGARIGGRPTGPERFSVPGTSEWVTADSGVEGARLFWGFLESSLRGSLMILRSGILPRQQMNTLLCANSIHHIPYPVLYATSQEYTLRDHTRVGKNDRYVSHQKDVSILT